MRLIGAINLVCFVINMRSYLVTGDPYYGLIGVINLAAVGICFLTRNKK